MPERLPPLTALRAFEAAARHMSFAKAAEELNVTPAALSFQIKSLEDHLGHTVFKRLNRAVELTELGEALAPGLQAGFIEINKAWSKARRATDQSVLTITAGPAFTALWLAPRLYSFAAAHPEIDLRFSASLNLIDFERDDIDLAIRFGQGGDEGLFSRPLTEEWMTPMMTPEMAKKVTKPQDMLDLPLVHDDQSTFLRPPVDWDAWFTSIGLETPEPHGSRFNQADHAINAAVAGVGAVMGRISLAEGALRAGRLVMPFAETLRSSAAYRIVCPAGTEVRAPVAQFIEWIEAEMLGLKEFDADRRFIDLAV